MFALTSPEISTALHPALRVLPTDSTVTVPVVSSFVTEIFGASGLPHGLTASDALDGWLQFTLLWARTVAVYESPSEIALLSKTKSIPVEFVVCLEGAFLPDKVTS